MSYLACAYCPQTFQGLACLHWLIMHFKVAHSIQDERISSMKKEEALCSHR